MRNTDPHRRGQARRAAPALWLPLLLSILSLLAMLYLLTGLFPMPDGQLAVLAQRPDLLGASPARVLLEGMALWYRSFLVFLAAVLAIVALALFLAFRSFLRHRRWCKAHREAYRQALTFSFLVKLHPALVVEGPWNYNSKSGLDPTPGWWDWVWEEKERADALIETYRLHSWRRVSGFLSLTPLLLTALLIGVMVLSEEVPGLYRKARADIAQLEAGGCETVTVWLSPKVREWHIDGPYTSSQPALLTRYGVISEDTGGRWISLFVPYGLDFALDPDRLYDEDRAILWNAENAQMYEVAYTPNLFLIDSITPADPPEGYF